ncbi:MAG: HEAT repeat domain-containing protein [Phycisphaerales bacterium]|nr:MAG: HEAT repeat domain-containing protein [Phycisphaerales bacterium]
MRSRIVRLAAVAVWLYTISNGITAERLVPSQYPTIQAAVDAAVDGDEVIIAPGRYTGDGNRDIDFSGKAMTVRSEGGPESCIIDCQGSEDDRHRGFLFESGETANSVLQGFTITGGFVYTGGGAIYCYRSSPTIRDCIIIRNTASEGGGIACLDSGVTVNECVITDNLATTSGGGVAIIKGYDTDRAELANCIVTGNQASRYSGGVHCGGNAALMGCTISGNRTGEYGYGGGIGFNACHPHCTLKESVVWGNMASGDEEIILIDNILGVGRVRILHSVVGDDPNAIQLWGFGADYRSFIEGEWLSLDPLLVRPGYWDPNETPEYANDDFWVDGDYHLESQAGRWDPQGQSWVRDEVTSPCIDAGDPSSPLGQEPFPNGGIINIGAYGGTAEASKSYFDAPVCETVVAGDINGDCRVDFVDLVLMGLHWLERHYRQPEDLLTLLEQAIDSLVWNIATYQLVSSSGDFCPVPGLDDPEAVPFLVDVLENGPDREDREVAKPFGDRYPHVAKSYAALCLGKIGDPRGLDPLVGALGDQDSEVVWYAAVALGYMGSPDAVDPLIQALEDGGPISAVYALRDLRDIRAIRSIIEYASAQGRFDYRMHRCLEIISRARFTVRYLHSDGEYTVMEFPELGSLPSDRFYEELWRHWLKVGGEFARSQFEQYHPKLQLLKQERPDDTVSQNAVAWQMMQGGIATLPYMIEEIKNGDESLVAMVWKLVGPNASLEEDATGQECLEWWAQNKDEWLLSFDEE